MLELQQLVINPKLIDKLYTKGSISREAIFGEGTTARSSDGGVLYDSGQFYHLVSEIQGTKHSALCVAQGDQLLKVSPGDNALQGIKPRDVHQKCFAWSLRNYDLTIGLGAAGTGKTTLAMAYALHLLFREDKNIVLTKPTMFVGGNSNAIAAVPGGVEEKMAPYIESYMVIMRKLLGDDAEHFVHEFLEKGRLTIQPLELIRGMNFDDSVVILDEAQNTTTHELLSFISRVGETSKCIILGDPAQVDIELGWRETGLHALISSDTFYDSEIAKGIKLQAQYRGPLAQMAAEVLEELNGEEDE